MTNCNVAVPPHPLDPRYVDSPTSPTRHQHPSDFDRMRNDSPFSHTHEKWPRHAATDCYWSLSTLKPHFPSSVLPDVLSAHPEHRRPATASSMTSATTVRPLPCVVHIFLQLFFLPVFMVNWPVSDDVAELVADTILPSFLSTFVFPRLPCPPPPPQMTRYDTTHGGSRYWLIFSRLPAIMHTRFSLPRTPIFWPDPSAYLPFSSSDVSHIYFCPLFSWVPILPTLLCQRSPHSHTLEAAIQTRVSLSECVKLRSLNDKVRN